MNGVPMVRKTFSSLPPCFLVASNYVRCEVEEVKINMKVPCERYDRVYVKLLYYFLHGDFLRCFT